MKKLKTRFGLVHAMIACALVVWILACLSTLAAGGNSVAPATCTFTNTRGEATAPASAETFYRGDTLWLTNCVAYSTSTGGPVQMLSNVTVTVAVGNSSASTIYTGTVLTAALGTWCVSFAVPTSGTVYVETRLLDENTNSYTYSGWKLLSVQDALH